jgi:hypothetical protein
MRLALSDLSPPRLLPASPIPSDSKLVAICLADA